MSHISNFGFYRVRPGRLVVTFKLQRYVGNKIYFADISFKNTGSFSNMAFEPQTNF